MRKLDCVNAISESTSPYVLPGLAQRSVEGARNAWDTALDLRVTIPKFSEKQTAQGIDTMAITELADYMRSIGLPIPDNYPFAGRAFNVTRAGIHAGGLRQDERIYNIFNTEKLLGRPPRVAITDKSGADGVVHWVNEFFGLKEDDRINKIKIHRLARWVIDQYEQEGRLTAISDQELAAKAKEFFPDYWAKYKAGK